MKRLVYALHASKAKEHVERARAGRQVLLVLMGGVFVGVGESAVVLRKCPKTEVCAGVHRAELGRVPAR